MDIVMARKLGPWEAQKLKRMKRQLTNAVIGTDYNEAAFFSGLIDDVRIYDLALSAEEIAALAQ